MTIQNSLGYCILLFDLSKPISVLAGHIISGIKGERYLELFTSDYYKTFYFSNFNLSNIMKSNPNAPNNNQIF